MDATSPQHSDAAAVVCGRALCSTALVSVSFSVASVPCRRIFLRLAADGPEDRLTMEIHLRVMSLDG